MSCIMFSDLKLYTNFTLTSCFKLSCWFQGNRQNSDRMNMSRTTFFSKILNILNNLISSQNRILYKICQLKKLVPTSTSCNEFIILRTVLTHNHCIDLYFVHCNMIVLQRRVYCRHLFSYNTICVQK